MRIGLMAGLVALLAAAPLAAGAERGQDELRRDMEFAKEQVYPALVNISVVVRDYSGGRSQRFPAAGSGVIVSPAGHVVTNFHVAGDTTRIVCRLPTKESIEADVIAHDPLTDISILKLRLDKREDPNVPLPFARFGDSDELLTGDYVLAMGNPLTLSSSMTLGIVSNPKRVFATFTGSDLDELDLGDGQKTGMFTQYVQHDALILPGNSGGPLVNLKGEVVGINELGMGGAAFAIPSNLVRHVLNQALTHGEVIRGWLGIGLYPVEKMGREKGVLVASVQPGGPAEQAGIRPGDVLLSLDGRPTDAVFFEEIPLLYKRFADLAPGRKAAVAYLRGGDAGTAALTVARMQPYLADQHEVKPLGLTVRDITGPMALIRRYPSSDGVLVTGIRPGYPADDAKPQVRSGDVILELDGKKIGDYAALGDAVAKLGKRDGILIRVRRGDEEVVTVLDTSEPKKPFSGGELPKAWIGIRTQVLTPDVAKALGMGDARGFRITQVFPRTEAEKAGLKVGDVITALNGDPLRAYRTQDTEMLERRVENLGIGDKARLTLLRDGGETTVDVVLQETPRSSAEAKGAEDSFLEYKVRDITFGDKIDRRWPMDRTGVLVTNVTPGGWAMLAGLQAGDLIQRIGGRKIESVADFRKAVAWIEKEHPASIALFVVRGYRTAFVFAQPEYGE